MLGLRFCARAFSSCGKRGPLFIAVRGPLTIVASLVAEHRLQTRRLSNCGSRAQSLRGMWDPPGPGLEPVVPCIGRRTLNHCTTREAPIVSFARYFWRKKMVIELKMRLISKRLLVFMPASLTMYINFFLNFFVNCIQFQSIQLTNTVLFVHYLQWHCNLEPCVVYFSAQGSEGKLNSILISEMKYLFSHPV